MKHKILMIPGSTEMSREVLAKLALPVEPHYGDEFVKLYFEVVAKLKKIFETSNDIFILAATSSAAMEAAVNCSVEKGDKVSMTNRRPRVVVTDCNYFSLELERRVLDEINPEFVVAHSLHYGKGSHRSHPGLLLLPISLFTQRNLMLN